MQTPSSEHDDPFSKSTALGTLWKLVCGELIKRLGKAQFDRWFSPVKLVRLDVEALWFSAPNTIYSLWIEENYLGELEAAVALQLPSHPPIRFEIAPSLAGDAASADLTTTGPVTAPDPAAAPLPEPATVAATIDTPGDGADLTPAPADPMPPESEHPVADTDLELRKWKTSARAAGLIFDYQFDNFVVGSANRLAAAAARAVAEKPGRTYHPLFIHSASGLGKTHLLHAIGLEALRRRPRSKVIYLSAERFANEYIEAIQKHDLVAFRKRYRQADVLLIDDIQFLSGKEGMQEEFFHTFNSLTDRHKQIVLASDRPATEIRELEDRLVSRFQWGMTAEIVVPTIETRIAILRRKREERKANVPDWVIEYISNHVTSNVRAMEGALIRAATLGSINEEDPEPIDEPTLEELLAPFTDAETARQVSVHEIQELVAEHFDVTVRDINGRRRTSRLVDARHVAMALARERTDLSLTEIGKEFGGRDHGTVINACKKVAAKAETQASIRRAMEFLRRSLLSGQSTRRSKGPRRDFRDRDD